MCVLCADLNTALHWSDAHVLPAQRMRLRMQRVKIANKILKFYGLKLRAWGTQFILEDQKGRRELVKDLGGLCYKAQNLSSKPLDILDPALLDFLSRG
ncbi:hypothetical protein [Helicobacter salomonis]|uniref:hypothetical protein n=1 Tax=Helicobacter salomonis TaxID=56878 RepID=UPI000CF1AE45|nr:hypothetical protein [Helicobacter salomonis]